jgi:hypothetical protein
MVDSIVKDLEKEFNLRVQKFKKEGYELLDSDGLNYYEDFFYVMPKNTEYKISSWGKTEGILFGTNILIKTRFLLALYKEPTCWRGGKILYFRKSINLG